MIDLSSWLLEQTFNPSFKCSNDIASKVSGLDKFVDLELCVGKFSGGATGVITGNYATQTKHHHQLKLYGTRGTYVHEFNTGTYYFGDDRNIVVERDTTVFPSAHKGALLQKFVDFLAGKIPRSPISSKEVFDTTRAALHAI